MLLLISFFLIKYFIYSGVFAVVNKYMETKVPIFRFGAIRILVGLFVGFCLLYINMVLEDKVAVAGVVLDFLYFFTVFFSPIIWVAEWYFCFRLAYGNEFNWRQQHNRALLILASATLLSLVINILLALFNLGSFMSYC